MSSAVKTWPIATVFGQVPHQLCTFHILKEVTKAVLSAVAKLRAYAKGLGLDNDQKALSVAVKDMYRGDEYLSKLAETTVNVEATDK